MGEGLSRAGQGQPLYTSGAFYGTIYTILTIDWPTNTRK